MSYGTYTTKRGKEVKIEESIKLALNLIKVSGLWHIKSTSQIFYAIYKVYTIVVKFVACYFLVGMWTEVYISRNDPDAMLEMVITGIAHINLVFKMYIFIFKKDEIQHIIHAVQKNFFIHDKELTIENKDIIRRTIRRAKYINIIFAAMINFTFVLFSDVSPLVRPVRVKSVEAMESNMSINNATKIIYERNFPINTWFPFDVAQSPRFEITYVFLTIASHIEGLNYASTDGMFFTLMICVTGQFELLSDALRNMSKNINLRVHHPAGADVRPLMRPQIMDEDREELTASHNSKEHTEGFSRSSTSTFEFSSSCVSSPLMDRIMQKEADRYLKDCIKYQQSLLEFSEKLDHLWQTIFFVQFLTASIWICFIGFKALVMPLDINFLKIVVVLISVLFQLGLFCSFGSNLMMQSEAVFNAAYESEWYNQSEHYKYCTGMIIMRAQRPVRITAGIFGTVSLPLFAAMLQSSYSYLALLRQMHED